MKFFKFALWLSAMLIATTIYAQEKQEPAPKITYKDQLLSLVLEKTKTYTEAGEKLVTDAIDEVKVQAPDVFKQYITWKIVEHGSTGAISLFALFLAVTAAIVSFRRGNKKSEEFDALIAVEEAERYTPTQIAKLDGLKKRKKDCTENHTVFFIISCIATFVTLVVFSAVGFEQLQLTIKAIVAPKVYILDELIKVIR